MKWLPYIAIWIYGIAVTGLGFASIYNPVNAKLISEGRIPTDIFTVIGIILLYFAYASTKQYFNVEARDTKRFDLLIIAVMNMVVMFVPMVLIFLMTKNFFGNMEQFSSEPNFYKTLIGAVAVFIVIVASYIYSLKVFLYNK